MPEELETEDNDMTGAAEYASLEKVAKDMDAKQRVFERVRAAAQSNPDQMRAAVEQYQEDGSIEDLTAAVEAIEAEEIQPE